MQINTNTTGMEAGLTVATDKNGRDHCVVVVKGTFVVGRNGEVNPAEKQEPLVATDVHYGDPGVTSVKYECEFAMFKPRADVIVNGEAVAPDGRPVRDLTVTLEIGTTRKAIRVVGDRRWERGILGITAPEPAPFLTMPLVYERAFGGSDHSHPSPRYHGSEVRNLVGVGFHRNSDPETIEGQPLPNLEHLRHPMRVWSDTAPPVGFGSISRNWQPRLKHAGTYDERWMKERLPFLPRDFDEQYFLSAPPDQQVPFLRGGEGVRCLNMTPEGVFEFRVPSFDVPILFVFRFPEREIPASPNLDTLIVEPALRRFQAIWRANVPLGRKLNALREVIVGPMPEPEAMSQSNDQRSFQSLAQLAEWNSTRGGLLSRNLKK
jgi:hypothetical protein